MPFTCFNSFHLKSVYDTAVDLRIRLEPAIELARGFPQASSTGCASLSTEAGRAVSSLKSLAAAFDAAADMFMGTPGRDAVMDESDDEVERGAELPELVRARSLPTMDPEVWRNGVLDAWAVNIQSMPSAPRTGVDGKVSFKAIDNRPSAQMRTILQSGKHLERCHKIKGAIILLENTVELAGSHPRHYDDGELYRSLLREVIESGDAPGGGLRYAQLSRSGRVRKKIDRRASKGRKLRYVVHEKLVGFLAPIPLPNPGPIDAIVAALFGGTTVAN
jgi:Apoptosis-antagonizing transcription factor, C-terminal